VDDRRPPTRLPLPGPHDMRLRLVVEATDHLSSTEFLPFALAHAVAALGGLGGMVHRSEEGTRGLRLAAASGLPREMAEPWEDLAWDEATAPARAVRECRFLWLPVGGGSSPAPGSPDRPETPGSPDMPRRPGMADIPGISRTPGVSDAPEQDGHARAFPAGTGLAAVPLPGADGPLGALSVLTAQPHTPPPEQRAFLSALADVIGDSLRRPQAAGILTPTWWQVPTGSHLSQAMRAVSVGTWDWDMRTGRLIADEPSLHAVGLSKQAFTERIEEWADLIHPDDAAGIFGEIDRAVADKDVYSAEYRVVRPAGDIAWIEARGHITFDDSGEPLRMTGTLWETTETRTAHDAMARALQYLPDGFLAVDTQWQILYSNPEAERILGAPGGLLGRVLWDAVPDLGALELPDRYHQATGTGAPVGFDIQAPADKRWYHMRLVPVPNGLTLYFTDVTEKRAQQAERDRAARAAAQRAASIGELTEALAQALTVDDAVRAMADHMLPLLDATGLGVMALEGERLHVLGTVGYDKGFSDLLEGLDLSTMTPAAEVLRDRTPLFIPTAQEYQSRYPHLAHIPVAGRKQAWAFLPLIASGKAIGYSTFSFDKPRTLSEEERTLLVALSGLAAHALERARLYDAEHSRAQELQRGLLPHTLPDLPAVTSAASYIPAGTGAEVGGDWYDVLPLSAERVALVIGDVMGHGVPEAVTMGRLRTAVHTLADLEMPPDELLTRLDSLITSLGAATYATCLYGVYDPTNRTLTYASAGHPPPAIVHPDGSVVFPSTVPDPPLGVLTPPLGTTELVLPEESLIVLYTDGLIESADTDIDEGMNDLAGTLAAALGSRRYRDAGPPVQDGTGGDHDSTRLGLLCTAVTSGLLPKDGRHSDDAALLIARSHALDPGDMASWPLPENPVAAGQARKCVRDQLAEWGLDDLAMSTELLVSELVGNVVRHARGPVHLRMLRGRTLVCEVSDGSLTTPRIRHAGETDEGGRGLQLVAALSDRWGARFTKSGKYIWTEQSIPPHPLSL
jgi:PAS domain-containing protein/anti-sigma regulatory factor (Ser/Thr protein kinase)